MTSTGILHRRSRFVPGGAKGFTLVELLVVIGIIVILAGISFPAMHSAIDSAHSGKCLANLHAIGVATANYSGDNEGVIPYQGVADAQGNALPAPAQLLEPYIRQGSDPSSFESDPVWICPGDAARLQRPSYYAWNSYGINDNLANVRMVNITSPGQTMYMADCMGPSGSAPADCETTVIYDPTFLDNTLTRARHRKQINALFLDGHVENMTTIPDYVATSSFWFTQ
jgi:prepilin-type N-terminal cleavage/methylation domain-containing protein/prepilin-type processing-associated H-X9-DG protein